MHERASLLKLSEVEVQNEDHDSAAELEATIGKDLIAEPTKQASPLPAVGLRGAIRPLGGQISQGPHRRSVFTQALHHYKKDTACCHNSRDRLLLTIRSRPLRTSPSRRR
jgi:hypothetical protein